MRHRAPGSARALCLVSLLAAPLGCASDDGAGKSAPVTAQDESDAEGDAEYDRTIATAIDMSRDIRQRWQRGEPRDPAHETRALKLFLRAAELRPGRVEGPYGAAVMLVAACQGDRDACADVCPPAFAMLDRADAIERGYRYSTWNRGVCLEGIGRFQEALLSAEHALAEYPDDPDMWALRAKVRISLGYLDGACEDLARMFDLMGKGDHIEGLIAPYGCRLFEGVPRYVPTQEPGVTL